MEAFGIVDLFQEGLQVCLCLLKGLITVYVDLLTLHGLHKTFHPCILGCLPRCGHTDASSDTLKALHIGLAAILWTSIGVVNQSGSAPLAERRTFLMPAGANSYPNSEKGTTRYTCVNR